MHDVMPVGPMSFLAGDGEMAQRIRANDWSGHPFGRPETWPQSLRSALGICLQSAFPTAIYWGADLRLLYNDAWAHIPGPRHPAALGAAAREVWSDIWHVIEPQFETVLATGEGIFVENQHLPMARFGAPEETYWNYSFTPLRAEDGRIAGVFNSGSETTRLVLAQRQSRFLLELGEMLRSVDADSGWRKALDMVGQQLSLTRIGFAELTEDRTACSIGEEWCAPDMEPTGAPLDLAAFGADAFGELAAGRDIRVDDVAAHPDPGNARQELDHAGVGALAAVPWMEAGSLAGVVYLQAGSPRDWNDFEVGTVAELIDRMRTWAERQRAAEREQIMMREIDHRARNVLAVAQSVVRLTTADDLEGFRTRVGERIGALSRAHTLLAANQWAEVDLSELLRQELAAHAGSESVSIETDGPKVDLPADLTQTVSLVLHELVTNAAKYGALGVPGSALRVTWSVEEPTILDLRWTESIPENGEAPRSGVGSGFGSGLLSRVVEAQLGGTIERDFTEAGLNCRIVFPLHGGRQTAARAIVPGTGPRPDNLRVLIAEDEAVIAMDLEATVSELGHVVCGVYAAAGEAIAALDSVAPDIALLDGRLKDGPSVLLAERLHRQGVPVIFTTGYDAIADLPKSLAGTATLTKPISKEDLAVAIDRTRA